MKKIFMPVAVRYSKGTAMNSLRQVILKNLRLSASLAPPQLAKRGVVNQGNRGVSRKFEFSSLQHRNLTISCRNYGVEEFFERPENVGIKEIKSAAPWSRDLLRLKSLEDLHKLWYVLLKERNMLLTMMHFYETEDEPMPSPERLEKVAESMSNLRDVLEEREKAKNMLLLGRPTEGHGEYRKSGKGDTYWYHYQPYLLPKHLNKEYYGDRPADIASFDDVLNEWHIRYQERKAKNLIRRKRSLNYKWMRIRISNPHLPKHSPQWWLSKFHTKLRYGVHPELPVLFLRKRNQRYRKHWVG